MGTALFTVSALFATLQELVTRLLPAHKPLKVRSQRRPLFKDTAHRNVNLTTAAHACPVRGSTDKDSEQLARRTLQLRVVRPVESGVPAGRTGRMVISGRMADVCAELERLAALEAVQDSFVQH